MQQRVSHSIAVEHHSRIGILNACDPTNNFARVSIFSPHGRGAARIGDSVGGEDDQ